MTCVSLSEFVAECIKHILSLYSGSKVRPTISCHSCTFNGEFIIKAGKYTHIAMTSSYPQGGLVAQALFGVKEFNSSWVTTIIALASPLRQPVLSFDYSLHQFYNAYTR